MSETKTADTSTAPASAPEHPLEAPDGPGYAYIDGSFGPLSEARIPLMDWGVLRSDACYDSIKVTENRLFRLDDHIARLRRSAELLEMEIAESWEEVASILAECVHRSGLETCMATAVITRGVPPLVPPLGWNRSPRAARNRFHAMAVPMPWIIRPEEQDRALAAWIGTKIRIDPRSVDPTIKNFHWQDLVLSLLNAQDHDAETTILLDFDGNATEGPGFNLFALCDGVLITPDSGVLKGITRKTVIEIAADLEIPCEEATLTLDALRGAQEVFGSSTAGGVVPIGTLDGNLIGDGRPGPTARRIRDKLYEYQRAPKYTVAVDDVRPA